MSQTPPEASRVYPPDEFDDLDPQQGRRGAHRAKPSPVLAMLPVLLVVLAVVAVVVAVMTLLGGGRTATSGADLAREPAAVQPPAAPAPDVPTPSEVTPDVPEATLDTSVPVTVLNGTRRAGLAAQASEVLRAGGWTVAAAGNYRGDGAPPTTVFYPREDLAATAAAVAEALGGAAATFSDDLGEDGLTVVLGQDYRP